MKRTHLFALASVMALACTDEPTANSGMPDSRSNPVPIPSTAALSGRIIVSGIGADRIVELRDDHDDVFRLLGNETNALANVDGGDVVVWGTWDANPGFVVSEFSVTGMLGRPALDGVLQAADDGGFVLRLADGSLHAVPGLAADCVAYVGNRIWVVGWDDGADVQFGLIAGQSSQ